jgi:hypothetical protein
MLELWNNWYETVASVEALATVIVIAVLGAGVIMLTQVGGDNRTRVACLAFSRWRRRMMRGQAR